MRSGLSKALISWLCLLLMCCTCWLAGWILTWPVVGGCMASWGPPCCNHLAHVQAMSQKLSASASSLAVDVLAL